MGSLSKNARVAGLPYILSRWLALCVPLALYRLLKGVNRTLAVLMAILGSLMQVPLFFCKCYSKRRLSKPASVLVHAVGLTVLLRPAQSCDNWRNEVSKKKHRGTAFPFALTAAHSFLVALLAVPLVAQRADQLVGKNVSVTQRNYEGQSAIQVIATPGAANATSYALIRDVSFRDGTIELELAGKPAAGAGEGARGFMGVAFRLQNDRSYEYIYLRPTNGRADDQVRRNHSTQYSSYPDFDFARSRREAPEKYESYVDLQSGVWTKYKIEVEGRKARLCVNGAQQPCLIVNDMKLEPREGGVALWVGPGTEGYFSNLKITAK